MAAISDMRKLLTDPLKQACLSVLVGINPIMLDAAAEAEIAKVAEKIAEGIKKTGEGLGQDLIDSIGPEVTNAAGNGVNAPAAATQNEGAAQDNPNTEAADDAPQTVPQPVPPAAPQTPPTTPESPDFPKNQKNDILDQQTPDPNQRNEQTGNPISSPDFNEAGEQKDKKDTNPENRNDSPQSPAETSQQDFEEREEAKKEPEVKERSGITQSLNTNLLQKGKIDKIEAKIKKEEQAKKRMQGQLRDVNITLEVLQVEKASITAAKALAVIPHYFLCAFNYTMGCGILEVLLPITFLADNFICRYIKMMEDLIKGINKKIESFQKRKDQLIAKIKELDKLIQNDQKEIHKLKNTGIIEGMRNRNNNSPA